MSKSLFRNYSDEENGFLSDEEMERITRITNPGIGIIKRLLRFRINTIELTFKCKECGTIWEEQFGPGSIMRFFAIGTECPNCHKKNYNYIISSFLSVAIAFSLATIGAGFL